MCKCGLVINKNLKFDLRMDLMILYDLILFPLPFKMAPSLPNRSKSQFPGGTVLTPLFGHLINIHRLATTHLKIIDITQYRLICPTH